MDMQRRVWGQGFGVSGNDDKPQTDLTEAATCVAGPPRHVYVHVPFCARRCSYCDFAIAVRRNVPVDAYVNGIARELALRFPVDEHPWHVRTIYLGGGTPSALGPSGVQRLLAALQARLTPDTGAEVTLEANPEDVTDAASAAWRSAGVTRVSIGAQSFNPDALAWMHRSHSPSRVAEALHSVRSAGIANASLDLIFGLPASIGRSWAADLDVLLSLAPEHVSLYGLTVEPGTAVARWIGRGATVEAPEEAYEGEYLHAHELLAGAGYEHYEVSNFARPGYRACHNAAYWAGVPYVGLGPAAHEFDGTTRRWNQPAYTQWLGAVSNDTDPAAGRERLTPDNRVSEQVYLELRTVEGTVLNDGEKELVAPWIQAGWARLARSRLALAPTGWLRLDSLAVALANVRTQ
jgi:oxygen-independent coproporphyrinogen-3 oxidase